MTIRFADQARKQTQDVIGEAKKAKIAEFVDSAIGENANKGYSSVSIATEDFSNGETELTKYIIDLLTKSGYHAELTQVNRLDVNMPQRTVLTVDWSD